MAVGFSVRARQLAAFHTFLDERLAAVLTMPDAADLVPEGTWAVSGATAEVARHVERLAPFGVGNEEPVLVLHRARVVRAERVGREAGSIRTSVEDEAGGPLKTRSSGRRRGAGGGVAGSGRGAAATSGGHLWAQEWNGSVSPCWVIQRQPVA
jgi:single-stranded-DNA-specific exonuclease